MAITVKFFASLREQVGKDSAQVEGSSATAAELWQRTTEQPLPLHVLVAINMEYAQPQDRAHDGDEVAFFPPVTGGAR